MNNLRFEIQTQIMKQLKTINTSKHFLTNIMQDYEVDAKSTSEQHASSRPTEEGAVQGMTAGGFITKNALAQTKSEVYDYLELKLNEIHATYI